MVWIHIRIPRLSPFLALLALASICNAAPTPADSLHGGGLSPIVSQTECGGAKYTYDELAGYGFVASNFRDKFGDTLSVGSSIALEKGSWKQKTRRRRAGGTEKYYTGTLWMLPDRGWFVFSCSLFVSLKNHHGNESNVPCRAIGNRNTNGTTLFQPRIHKFNIEYTPLAQNATGPSPPNIKFLYRDTIRFTDPSGEPVAVLDPTTIRSYDRYPPLPAAQYTGNGFGGPGKGGIRVSLDPEGLVLAANGTGFWISDEYGPYIYRFDSQGKMELAVRPPEAYIPKRNGTQRYTGS